MELKLPKRNAADTFSSVRRDPLTRFMILIRFSRQEGGGRETLAFQLRRSPRKVRIKGTASERQTDLEKIAAASRGGKLGRTFEVTEEFKMMESKAASGTILHANLASAQFCSNFPNIALSSLLSARPPACPK